MIKVISFDIGGTILQTKSINNYNLKRLTELVGVQYDLVRTAYKDIFQKEKGSLEELVSKFCNKINIEVNSDILSFFDEKFKPENNISVLEKEIVNIIKKLRDYGYKIILFSNSCCLIQNNFSNEFLENIDEIFYSYDIGYTKDDESSYKFIEKKWDIRLMNLCILVIL